MVEILQLGMEIGAYEHCWFEIKTNEKRIVTKDHQKFMRKSGALSRLHDVTLYKIERTVSGPGRSRIHTL